MRYKQNLSQLSLNSQETHGEIWDLFGNGFKKKLLFFSVTLYFSKVSQTYLLSKNNCYVL